VQRTAKQRQRRGGAAAAAQQPQNVRYALRENANVRGGMCVTQRQ